MKYSVKKFTALLLALIMVLSLAPLDAIASVFTTYEANVVIDSSESAHLQENFFTQSVSTPEGNKAGTVLVGTLREESLLNGSTVEFSEVPAQTRLMKAVAPVSNSRTIARYNITVKNPDDSVWQPDQESGETVDVRVTLNNPVPLIPGDKLSLIHEPDGRDVGATFYKNTNNEMTGFTFEATGFSVYAVVATGEDARLKVKFNSNNTEIASMLVKQADTENANLYNTILYDPGVGTLPEGVIFLGWTDQTTYDLETVQKLSIEDVRNAVAQKLENGVTDLDEVTYYAILTKQYRVDYLDENDVSVVDISKPALTQVAERLDVKPVFGHASDISVLKEAGIEKADIVVAATAFDEINMTVCQIADFMFHVPTKIASIGKKSYFAGYNLFEN